MPVQPKSHERAHDPRVFARGGLAVQLRPAVHRQRVRRVRLDVRRALRPVEDVVGREVDERGAELGRVLRAADVHGRGRPAGRPPRRRRPSTPRRAARGRPRRERPAAGTSTSQLGARQAARAGERLEERRAELAARAGYEDVSRSERIGDVVLHRWRTRASSHGMPCSSGFAASYSSVTRYAKRQSVSAS